MTRCGTQYRFQSCRLSQTLHLILPIAQGATGTAPSYFLFLLDALNNKCDYKKLGENVILL